MPKWRATAFKPCPGKSRAEKSWRRTASSESISSRPGRRATSTHRSPSATPGWPRERAPVSLSAFNASLPDIVQLVGIYTPPELRGRGYAQRAVAGSLIRVARYSPAADREPRADSSPAADSSACCHPCPRTPGKRTRFPCCAGMTFVGATLSVGHVHAQCR